MKKKICKVATLIAVIITLSSCQEDDPEMYLGQQETKIEQLQYSDNSNIGNDENYFNTIGVLHNSILMDVGYQVKEDFRKLILKKDVTDEDLRNIAEKIIHHCYNVTDKENGIGFEKFESELCKILDTANSQNIFPISSGIDSSIFQIVENANNNIEDLFVAIDKLEQRIIDKIKQGETSMEKDLLSLTIFKYSIHFWNDVAINSSNPWNDFFKAAYIKNDLTYIGDLNKGLFLDIWNSAKRVVGRVCDFVEKYAGNAIKAIVGATTIDYVAAKTVGSVAIFNIPTAAGLVAVGSALGGIYGWTH